jgi:DNA repair exonuclease SbcCD ATPase subunit
MISQNFTETDEDHGILVWDVATRASSLIRLENPYAFREIVIGEGGRLRAEEQELPSHGRVNVIFSRNKTADDIQGLCLLRERFPHAHISEKSAMPVITHDGETRTAEEGLDFMAILKKYFERIKSDDKDELMRMCVESSSSALPRNEHVLTWDILYLEWDNMFGYGGKNRLDLEKFPPHETIGIFGENSAGKSTLIDIILFLLYGQISRYTHGASVPREVIHFGETRSRGMIRFRVEGIEYEIEKHMTLSPKTHKIRVDEKMWRLQDGCRIENMSEEHRKKTDRLVIQRIGSCEQFLFTTIFLQQNEESFRSMTPARRKEFLFHILGLDQFEKIHQEKNDEYRLIKKEMEQQEIILQKMESEDMCRRNILEIEASIRTIRQEHGAVQNRFEQICEEARQLLEQRRPCPPNVLKEWDQSNAQIAIQEKKLESIREEIHEQTRENEQIHQQWCAHDASHIPDMDESWSTAWSELEILYKQQTSLPERPSITELFRGMESDPYALNSLDDFTVARFRELERQTPEMDNLQTLLLDKEEILRELDPRLTSMLSDAEIDAIQERPFTRPHDSLENLIKMASDLEKTYAEDWKWSEEWRKWSFRSDCDSCIHNQQRIGYDPQKERDAMAMKEIWEQIQENIQLHKEKVDAERIRQNRRLDKGLLLVEQKIKKEKEKIQRNRMLERRISAWKKIYQWYESRSQIEFMNSYVNQEIQKKKLILKQLEEGRRLRDSLNEHKNRLARLKDQEGHLISKLDALRALCDRLRQWIDDGRANEKDEILYQEKIKLQKIIESELRNLMEKEAQTKRELRIWEDRLEKRCNTMMHFDNLRRRRLLLQHFLTITGKDGFPMFLMEIYLPYIETKMNEIVRPFLRDKIITLRIEKKKESTNIILTLQSTTGAAESFYMGGMEAFIVDAALKIVFAWISRQPRCNLFIIDEGISVLDKKNLENVDQFFQFLENYFQRIFIISHLREVSDMVRHALLVQKDNGRSKIC